MKYVSTKKYGHESGFSCCFRQWKASSHCNTLHGYPLAFEFTFESEGLDQNNWVVDFGSLKWLKEYLTKMFDHTTLVASDDPEIETYKLLSEKKLIDARYIQAVGCEKIAEMVYRFAEYQIKDRYYNVKLRSVEVWEHQGNSARFEG